MGRGAALGPRAHHGANNSHEFELYLPPHDTQCGHVLYPAKQFRDGSWDLVGCLFGLGGQTLKGIRDRSGAQLEVKGGSSDSGARLTPDDKKLRIVIRAASLKAVQKAADKCAELLKPENYDFKDVAVTHGGRVRLELIPVNAPGGTSSTIAGRGGRAAIPISTGACSRAPATATTVPTNAWGRNRPAHLQTSHTATDRDYSNAAQATVRSPPGAQFQASAALPGPPPAAARTTQAAPSPHSSLPSPGTPQAAGSSWREKLTQASPSFPAMKRADSPGPVGHRNSRPSTPACSSPSPTAAAAPGPHCWKSAAGGTILSSPKGPGTPKQGPPAAHATSTRPSTGGKGKGKTKSEVPDAKGVPSAPALCKVLGLRKDIFLAQRGELVRKALDEAALGLHWHIAYTLIHSAADPSCSNASFLEVKDPIELVEVDSPDHKQVIWETVKVKGPPRKSSAEGAVKSGNIEGLMQWLYEYRDKTCVWTRDLRTLLQHVKKATRSAYYEDSAWQHAVRLDELMTASTHRSAIAVPAPPITVPAPPYDGARLPSPEEVETHGGNNDAINARDARCIEETFEALDGLADSIKLGGSLEKLLDENHESIYYAACEEIARAAETHLMGVKRIYERYKILHGDTQTPQVHTHSSSRDELRRSLVMLQSALQTAPQKPQEHPRGATGSNGSSCSKIEKATKKTVESASPQVQFVLLSLWSRYGTNGEKELKPPADDDGFQKVVSRSGNSEVSSTQHLRAATVQKFLLKNIKNMKDEDGKIDVGRMYDEDNRLRILNPDADSFKTDPFGITNQDVALRALDLAVRGLRRALIACSRVHGSSKLEGQSDAVSEIRRSKRSNLLSEVKSVGRAQDMTGGCAPLKLESAPGGHRHRSDTVKRPDAAVIYKPAARSQGSDTLMHDFATRHDLKRNSDWRNRQTEAFLTFDPHWGDPRFLSEFLRCVNQSHGDLAPGFAEKLTQLLKLRDKVAHQVHTINNVSILELKANTVRQSIQDMIDMVMGLQALTDDGTPQDVPEELEALQELSSAFDEYQCWRDRQRGTLKKGVHMVPRAYATVKGLQGVLDDSPNQPAQHQDDDLTAQNPEALSDLLNIYTRIALPNQ